MIFESENHSKNTIWTDEYFMLNVFSLEEKHPIPDLVLTANPMMNKYKGFIFFVFGRLNKILVQVSADKHC